MNVEYLKSGLSLSGDSISNNFKEIQKNLEVKLDKRRRNYLNLSSGFNCALKTREQLRVKCVNLPINSNKSGTLV